MFNESDLIEKLYKIEALFSGAKTKGEKEAAKTALEKIQGRLDEIQTDDPPIEWTLTTKNQFEKKLLSALLRRYGLKPYRYSRQRYTTVMVMASSKFINEILWPQYLKMSEVLSSHLNQLSDRIIKQAINENLSEEVREESSQIGYH